MRNHLKRIRKTKWEPKSLNKVNHHTNNNKLTIIIIIKIINNIIGKEIIRPQYIIILQHGLITIYLNTLTRTLSKEHLHTKIRWQNNKN